MASNDWMRTAVKRPGAFRKKAEEHHMSTAAYAKKVKDTPNASTRTKRQAALARTFSKYRPSSKRSSTRSKSRKSSRS